MEKYYTPDISEYHIGFEFEAKNSSDEIRFEWEKVFIKDAKSVDFGGSDTDYDIHDFNSDIVEDRIRVKYLDSDDIKSFGFIGERDYFENPDGRYAITRFSEMNRLNIWDEEYENSFSGFVKNKSELRRLLKQLRI